MHLFTSIIDVDKPAGQRSVGVVLIKYDGNKEAAEDKITKIIISTVGKINFDCQSIPVPDDSEEVRQLPIDCLVPPADLRKLGYLSYNERQKN